MIQSGRLAYDHIAATLVCGLWMMTNENEMNFIIRLCKTSYKEYDIQCLLVTLFASRIRFFTFCTLCSPNRTAGC